MQSDRKEVLLAKARTRKAECSYRQFDATSISLTAQQPQLEQGSTSNNTK